MELSPAALTVFISLPKCNMRVSPWQINRDVTVWIKGSNRSIFECQTFQYFSQSFRAQEPHFKVHCHTVGLMTLTFNDTK